MFIVVGVTGGIAAYKSVHIVRLLVKQGHDVHVVPTEDAVRFVGIPTWEAISRHPVTTSVHDDVARVRHVALGQAADLVVVAPATANSLAKMAAGLADDLLGTTLLATSAPVVVAPAMHTEMWRHAATQHNVALLRARGVHIVGPAEGELTGGDSGPGRMSEPEEIVSAALGVVGARRDLEGLSVVVSAGGTREPIDPVRFIGNRSSGRQGIAVAREAASRGASVTLVAAHVEDDVLVPVPGISIVHAATAKDLAEAVRDAALTADVVVMAAAVADYRVADIAPRKLTKEGRVGGLTLELVENEDILAGLARDRRDGQTIVGFAAEMPGDGETLIDRGRRKAARKDTDLLVVNEVGWAKGFERSENEVVLIERGGGVVDTVAGSKGDVAVALWNAIHAMRMKNR
ncbi:bifunctional phosphopantothenoylcysteine decarboxylase/phosphopantothenate--cysteine ligase CoaBC [Microbacterium sp. SLBN-146]|uniref:bifunctional phosphopantothenoylcysteine decarboxylase/phosphopantothenate--cysteine ligase CoaBC n=1 Tax=Microbacterium sp. SLBN-146 TaxID=2768457 RepID=UPI001153D566|nr:bifunctional phosphopantothenoylcysteine decarboxylase/phosphopantothenate--cysteine ligase CoaBC [Microbacterium sp. SLBN-146]TQJ32528.1 phosphopantothenoylcysteine decarboxylase/phosphopantothenate--cysteine ligase [Microbacterium sp. SLBN-146]